MLVDDDAATNFIHEKVIREAGFSGTIQEREARQELERREARFRALFERNPAGIVLADPVGRFVDFNEKFVELLVHERDHLLGMNVEQTAHPASIRQLRRIVQQIRSKGEVVMAEGQYMHKCTPVKSGRKAPWARTAPSM
ncbi:MAG: PAS domain S-box protein [Flavobacteriales bacterium]